MTRGAAAPADRKLPSRQPGTGYGAGRDGDLGTEIIRYFAGRKRPSRVLLLGNYGRGNLGDEGILAAILVSLAPVVDVTVVSRTPVAVTREHRVKAVKMVSLRGLVALLRADHIAIGGGGMFGNGINLMTSFLPVVALISQKIGKETLFLATGAYSSSPSWVQRCLRKVAASSVLVTVRDDESAAVLGHGPSTVVVDDPAITLVPAPADVGRAALAEAGVRPGRPLLGISLKPTHYSDRNEAQVSVAAALCDWWSRTMDGDSVMLCLSSRGDNGLGSAVSDQSLAERVLNRVSASGSVHQFGPGVSPDVMKAAIGQLQCVVGHRLHAQIYAWSMEVPLIGISYERKADSFLERYRLRRCDLWALDADTLAEWIKSIAVRS